MIRYKHLHILGGKGQKDLQQNQNISMRWNISFQWRLLQVAMLKKEARIKANAEICSVISVPASSAPICSWKLSLRRSPENQRQLDAQMQPLIAKWQRMTKRSGSYDNVVRSCSPDGSLACTSTPTSLPPCVSVHRPPKNLEREHNAATTVKFYAVARDRDAAGTLQYRRGLLQLSVPLSVAACSRTLLLGQSVTRQVERDVVLHRACWQLLPVIPMPGEGLAHRRQPIFDPTAVFWRLQPGLELHILDSEQATIVELGTFFFKLEWRLFAAANPTSSSARVSLTSSSFSFLQPVVACCGPVSMRLQLNCKARFMLPCSCLAAELWAWHFFHQLTLRVRWHPQKHSETHQIVASHDQSQRKLAAKGGMKKELKLGALQKEIWCGQLKL